MRSCNELQLRPWVNWDAGIHTCRAGWAPFARNVHVDGTLQAAFNEVFCAARFRVENAFGVMCNRSRTFLGECMITDPQLFFDMVHVAAIMHNDAIDFAHRDFASTCDPQGTEKDMHFSHQQVEQWIGPPINDNLGTGPQAEAHLKRGLMLHLADEGLIHGNDLRRDAVG